MVMEQAAKMVHFKNTKSLYARLFVSYFMKFTTITGSRGIPRGDFSLFLLWWCCPQSAYPDQNRQR